jgi:hypothetical protein
MLRITNGMFNLLYKILKPIIALFIGLEIVDELTGGNLYEKVERSRFMRLIDRVVDFIIGCMMKVAFHVFMTAITGGLWIFWLMYKRNKRRQKVKRA